MSSVHISTASNQAYVTPSYLVNQIAFRFGVDFVIDAAASDENYRCPRWFTEEENSLSKNWAAELDSHSELGESGLTNPCIWLNPPFRGVDPWMEKCKIESANGCKIVSLTLASLGTAWYRNHVEGEALSLILRERVIFDGQKDPFPNELMITLWGVGLTGLGFWSRKEIKKSYAQEEKR